MKTILLPTDFSGNSRNALIYANELYKEEACTFLLVHAYKIEGYEEGSKLSPVPGKSALEEAENRINKKLRKLMQEVQRELKDANHQWNFIAFNKPLVQAIQKIITTYDIHLIIIGTQGNTGSSEVVYGSNTVNLMEEVRKCPVLAVPAHVSFRPLKEIVLACNYKAELKDLEFIIQFSKRHKVPIRILHIKEEGGLTKNQKLNKTILWENLEKQKIESSFHSLEFLSIPLGIYSFTESRGSDMIVLINKKHSILEILLLDPLYKNLAHYSKVPVLVLPQN